MEPWAWHMLGKCCAAEPTRLLPSVLTLTAGCVVVVVSGLLGVNGVAAMSWPCLWHVMGRDAWGSSPLTAFGLELQWVGKLDCCLLQLQSLAWKLLALTTFAQSVQLFALP